MDRRVSQIGVIACGCGMGAVAFAVFSNLAPEESAPLSLSPIECGSEAPLGGLTIVRSDQPKPSFAVEASKLPEPSSSRVEAQHPTRLNLRQLLDLARETTRSVYYVPSTEDEQRLQQQEITLYGAGDLSTESWPPFLSSVLGSQMVGIVEVGQLDSVSVYRVVALSGESGSVRWGQSLPYVKCTELHEWTKRPQSLLMTILPLHYVEPSVFQDSIGRLHADLEDRDALALCIRPMDSRAILLFGSARTLFAIFEVAKELDIPLLDVWR
jgi:hypothetical protein